MERNSPHKLPWLQRLFTSPVFADDEEKTHTAYLLNIVLLWLLSITVVISFISLLSGKLRTLSAIIVVLLVHIGVLAMMRRGHVRLAVFLTLTTLWFTCMTIVAFTGGMHSPVFLAIISIILAAGLLTRGRIAVTFAVLSALLSGLMSYAQKYGYLPPPPSGSNELATWTAFSSNFIGAALLLYLATHARNQARDRARRSERELARKAAENQQMAQEAMEASEFKSRVMGRISHELRTPLAAIRGLTEMLHYAVVGQLSPEQHELTERIIEHTEHLESIFTELLEQSRFVSKQHQLVRMMFSPQIVTEQVLDTFRAIAENKRLTLDLHIADTFPDTLCSDPDKIGQILASLVSNAIKFTETGNVTVSLSRPDDKHWAIAIRDTGVGIPADAHQRIFEPFRQVDERAIREFGGIGLGLALVQQLTHMLQGTVTLSSTLGTGSTFTVTFPILSEYLC